MNPTQNIEAPGASPTGGEQRALRLLALGAVVGLVMAAYGIVAPLGGEEPTLPEDAIALVNGEVLRRDAYERLLAGFASDARNPIDDTIRKHILDRMIEEELLVQRALDLGLAEVDRKVRADLTSSLIAAVVSGAEEREPTSAELRAFYLEAAGFFTQPGRYRVHQILFRIPYADDGSAARARAVAAKAELDGGRPFAEVAGQYGDAEISPLPDALLPGMKLREYIGPSALDAALDLAEGETSGPVRSGIGFHLLRMTESTPPKTPAFEAIESQVYAEYVRRAGDRALRDYLDQLREEGEIFVALPAAQ